MKERKLKMKSIKELIEFLNKLEENNIYYRLNKVRPDALMAEVAVPGERWEIEFVTDSDSDECRVDVERFISDGSISDGKELNVLFEFFSD